MRIPAPGDLNGRKLEGWSWVPSRYRQPVQYSFATSLRNRTSNKRPHLATRAINLRKPKQRIGPSSIAEFQVVLALIAGETTVAMISDNALIEIGSTVVGIIALIVLS